MRQLVSELRPRALEDFAGNSQTINLIKQNLMRDYFSHIVIFYGKNGTGKSSLAECVALSLACEGKKEFEYNPCCTCEVCKSAISTNFESVKGIKKVDMTLVSKKDIRDVLNEIFVFEGNSSKNIFILEEMQALDKNQQKTFLEYLSKVPEDVYVFITTDRFGTGIIPALKNRSVVLEIKNPTFKEALKFFDDKCYQLGLKCSSKKVGNSFVKACHNNPRSIVTNMELFRSIGEITEVGLNSLFDLKENTANQVWKKLFDIELSLGEFIAWLKNLAEEESITSVFKELQFIAVDNLIIYDTVLENSELSTVEKGEIKRIINSVNLDVYEQCLKILEEEGRDDTHVISIITRCKIHLMRKETKESERVSKTKVDSITGSSYAQKYGMK